MSIVYISLGSNLGDRVENIKKASELVSAGENFRIKKKSSIYETEPVGGPPQDYFLNQIIEIETDISPRDSMGFLKRIESRLGAEKKVRWGPRIIDLDILLFDDLILRELDLEIPHPRLAERKFVLVPLLEINPELEHPVSKKKIRDVLAELKENQEVKLYSHICDKANGK